MADARDDTEQAPAPDGTPGGARRSLGGAVGLALVASLATVAVIAAVLLGGSGGTGPAAGSATGSAGSSSVPASSSSPSASLGPSSAAASPGPSSGSSPEASVLSPASSLIAVVDADGGLATLDDRGGSRAIYPAPGVVLGFPAWSPDGTRIAAVGQRTTDIGIYVFDVRHDGSTTGGPATVIYRSTDHPPFYLYWTPDATRLTFLTTEGSSIALRIAPADGSAPLDGSGAGSIVRRGSPLYFDWLDPDRLLLHVGVGAKAFTGVVAADGSSTRPTLPGTGLFRPAVESTDGRYVAYVRSGAAGSDTIVVSAPDGSGAHRVPVVGPAAVLFDPTGDRLASIGAVAKPATGLGFPLGPLRLIDAANGSVRTLLDGPAVAFFWAPDGRTIAALLPSRPGDQPPTADSGGLLTAARVLPSPPDGLAQAAGSVARLAFVDVATGTVRSERVVRLGNEFVDLLLPYFDQYALSHRVWSPDGSSLLLPLVDPAGRGQLTIVPADGSTSRSAAPGVKGFWSP